jgi:electron transfer flavoprotein alpha subunit
MPGVWGLAENREQTLELLGIGRLMADRLGVGLTSLICRDQDRARDFIAGGADEVLPLPALAEDQTFDAWIPMIVEEARKEDPDLFLVASTNRLKELAARVASRLNTGMCSECIKICFNEKDRTVELERLIYGGAAVQRIVCKSRPVMATVPPRTFEPAGADPAREGRIRNLNEPPRSSCSVLERRKRQRETRDVREAKVIVCVGRGIEKKEDLALARELADALHGEVAGTRPVTEELRWLPEDLCIGLSGIQIKPDLYIGMGVSGQIQHVTGFRDAKVICAINRDPNAPIFGVADLGIVGDLYDVVPKLIRELKR